MWETPSPFSTESVPPEFTSEQLQDINFLRRQCKRTNKELARSRRESARQLKTNVADATRNLKAKEAGLAKHHAEKNPAVIQAREELKNAKAFLSDFELAHTLNAHLDTIDHYKNVASHNWKLASTSQPKVWKGEFDRSAFNTTSTYVELGGKIHTGMNIVKARHANHWRIPSEMNIDLFDKKCNVDSEPSSIHCGDKMNAKELKKRRSSLINKKRSFKYPSHLPKFGMAAVDHPKYGLPFAKRQQLSTFLERQIGSMEKELHKIPTYPRHNQERRMEMSRSINEARTVYKEILGRADKKLRRDMKGSVKEKLRMVHEPQKEDDGDMFFLKKLENIESKHYEQLKKLKQ